MFMRLECIGFKLCDGCRSEFMVNAMDAEELRQSVRRSKRWKAEAPRLELPAPATTSLSGSGHDSDDDEVIHHLLKPT